MPATARPNPKTQPLPPPPASIVEATLDADAAPTPDAIAQRAYELFQARGGEHGYDVDDWLEAERDLTLAPEVT